MNKKERIWGLLGLLIAAALVWWFVVGQSQTPAATPTNGQATTTPAPGTGGTQTGAPAQGGAAAGTGASGSQTSTLRMHTSPYGFTVQYPSTVTLETTGVTPGGFSQGAIGAASLYVRMGTVVDRLSISISSEPGDVGACTEEPGAETATINGAPFMRSQTVTDQESLTVKTTLYRIVRNRTCYELRDVVTYSDIDKLSAAEVEQQRLNIQTAAAFMDTIIASFRFTN